MRAVGSRSLGNNPPWFSQGSLVNTMKEVRPTAFMGVPRVWEKMQEKMKAIGAKSSTVRRKVAAWAKDVGLQSNLAKMNQYVDVVARLSVVAVTDAAFLTRSCRASPQERSGGPHDPQLPNSQKAGVQKGA